MTQPTITDAPPEWLRITGLVGGIVYRPLPSVVPPTA